jgi:hypothetical protein
VTRLRLASRSHHRRHQSCRGPACGFRARRLPLSSIGMRAPSARGLRGHTRPSAIFLDPKPGDIVNGYPHPDSSQVRRDCDCQHPSYGTSWPYLSRSLAIITQPTQGSKIGPNVQFLCRTRPEADRQRKLTMLCYWTDAHPRPDRRWDQSHGPTRAIPCQSVGAATAWSA